MVPRDAMVQIVQCSKTFQLESDATHSAFGCPGWAGVPIETQISNLSLSIALHQSDETHSAVGLPCWAGFPKETQLIICQFVIICHFVFLFVSQMQLIVLLAALVGLVSQ